jgi:hypothetical protein
VVCRGNGAGYRRSDRLCNTAGVARARSFAK